ncbi:hypothetical protein [Actinomycetospora sp. TBRC 11914]|uniref:hypothetical protein n=1 Tax=Actinomycetospora sp. TBRC 11914 TaxID=2729387 RepID=UPI00145EBE56|nr:hypothetical protein [Actinomycetospora sp. TBRC 11914]NMO89087.1 hypothetical protein [Actinomycetospora sp. TBRC 11914]
MEVTREQAVAFRIAAQGLGRADDDGAAAVLALGLQHLGPTAAGALAARVPGEPVGPDDRGLELAWTHRGAPHWHLPGSRPGWAAALRPLGDDDAAARLGWSGPDVDRIDIAPLAASSRSRWRRFDGGAWPDLDDEARRVAAARGLRLAGVAVA